MATFVPISGPVVADTAYMDDKLVARDVAINLPEVLPATVDMNLMGTFTFPVWQLIQNMEAAITKIGTDMGLSNMLSPGMKPLEVRWVQPVMDANGNTRNVGCKAFLSGMSNKLPAVGVAVGSMTEHPISMNLMRYNLFVDGAEMWLIDRKAGIVRIAGKDYADLDSML